MPNLATASIKALGFPTTRSFERRFADIKNVKDFGAVGDGVTDDAAAIQAAVDYRAAPYTNSNRGIIFFPEGIYQIASPISYEAGATFTGTITGGTTLTVSSVTGAIQIGQTLLGTGVTNSPVIISGSGTTWIISPASANVGPETMDTNGITAIQFAGVNGAKIRGDFADALLKRSAWSPIGGSYSIENLNLENNNAAGTALLFHSIVGGTIINCQISAFIGIETWNSQSVTIQDTSVISGGLGGASIGYLTGNATTLIACDASGYAEGLRHFNAGLTVIGGRFEVNTVGFNLGVDWLGATNQSLAVFIAGISTESNKTTFLLTQASSIEICGCAVTNSKTGANYGIRIISGDHISIRATTVGTAGFDWSGSGVSIEGGDRISMDSVKSTNLAGTASWNVVSTIDVEFTNCNAPMPALADLPNPATLVTKNARRYISNGNTASPVFGAIAVGGGSNRAPVWTNGTNWVYG